MHKDACILTTKDFTILEVMLDRCAEADGLMATILRRKIANATVLFQDDVPASVATLSSRVSYHADAGDPDSRILSHDRMNSPTGLYLPITSPVGLALLGLSEGQAFCLDSDEGARHVMLEAVLYQPEAARRERAALAKMATPAMRRSALRVVT